MFKHLCSLDEDTFIPDAKASPTAILEGKIASSEWLESLGLDDNEVVDAAQHAAAREAFAAITAPMDTDTQKTAITSITVPQAVKHLVGMLTAYDWAFVEQAKELRGYCVAQLLEESKHPDAKYRLRAIEMLGKVTEVGLFTERIEIKKTTLSDDELEREIKARMDKYMGLMQVVDTVEDAELLSK